MKPQEDGLRKAAILVASLSRSAADRLLDQMDPKHARQVRQTILEMDSIDPEEQQRIVDEFSRQRPKGVDAVAPVADPHTIPRERARPTYRGGIELDGRLAEMLSSPAASFAPEKISGVSPPSASPSDRGRPSHESGPASSVNPRPSCVTGHASLREGEAPPFCFLREAEGEKLARLLKSERPQTIALVISHLPPQQAGNVLVRLPAALQADVVRRLVGLEETDPEILREVERALRSRFSEQVLSQRRRVAGLAAVAEILEASGRAAQTQILGNLASHDPRLADRLGPARLAFDELLRLDDDALAEILRSAGPELVMLALVGAPAEHLERVLPRFPQSEAGWVRRELDHVGPVRLSDVEEAQRRIAELAQRLALEGQIDLSRRACPSNRREEQTIACS